MILLRSIFFNVMYYLNCALWFIGLLPTLLVPRAVLMRGARGWARSCMWLHTVCIGSKLIVRGAEKIPPGALLVMSKHQSAWETIALLTFFKDPTFILKRELLSLPLFGWYLRKLAQIPIDREQRVAALKTMTERTQAAIAQGRQILIFPEGTRRPVGSPPDYKRGIARIYESLNTPCLPVALTSGLSWPRNTFLHYPYPIIIEFMDIIPAGLPTPEFFALASARIEARTNELMAEAGYRPAS